MAAFGTHLRQYWADCGGPPVRTMEHLTEKVGRRYPRTTIHDKLSARSLPDWEFVRTFVLACDLNSGVPLEQLGQSGLGEWRRRHQKLLLAVAGTRFGGRRARQAEALLLSASEDRGPSGSSRLDAAASCPRTQPPWTSTR